MKTRFAPSPTGEMHFGNIRTALFNYLVALKQHGDFLLRIEDTDKSRSNPAFTQQIYDDLHWLGIKWTDGPYMQSARAQIYEEYYQRLIDENKAYPCFCSDEKLNLHRKLQLGQGLPPRYSGACKKLSKEEIAAKFAAGQSATLRFKIADNEEIIFNDKVKGEQRFNSSDIGDFIIRRADGSASFMFCSVLDDSLMKVSLILRGADHLTNTPRQLLILRAFGMQAAQYGHISLIVNHDGGKFSKRLGALSCAQLRQQGFLPLAIANYLARVGHTYKEDPGFSSLANLAANFNLEHLSSSPARFDEAQLEYWQKQAVMALSDDEFWQWIEPEVGDLIEPELRAAFIQCVRPNIEFPSFARHYVDMIHADHLQYTDEDLAIMRDAEDKFFHESVHFVENSIEFEYESLVMHLKEKIGVKGKGLFLPLRVALTGQTYGPEMAGLLNLIGKERILARLKRAQKLHEAA